MDNILNFSSGVFGTLTTVTDQEGTWFVGAQVARMLEYHNPSDALKKRVPETITRGDGQIIKCKKSIRYSDADDEMKAVLWPGVSHVNRVLISKEGVNLLLMRSQQETAQKFAEWLAADVVPSLFYNGGYIVGQEKLPADEQGDVLKEIRNLREQVKLLNERLDAHEEKEAFLQKRRHELISDKKELKVRNKKLKKETKLQKEAADYFQSMCLAAQQEMGVLNSQLTYLKNSLSGKEKTEGQSITVDAEGLVIAIKKVSE